MAKKKTDINEVELREVVDSPKKDVGERTNQLLEIVIEKLEALPKFIADEMKFE
jgi:hypothetical protein